MKRRAGMNGSSLTREAASQWVELINTPSTKRKLKTRLAKLKERGINMKASGNMLDRRELEVTVIVHDKDGNHYAAAFEQGTWDAIQFLIKNGLETVVPITKFELTMNKGGE